MPARRPAARNMMDRNPMLQTMWKVTLAAAAFIACGACAPLGPSREELRFNSYVGGSASAMVRDKGTPWRTLPRDGGGRRYIWRECRMVFDRNGNQHPRFCETRADVAPDGTLQNWRWHGNECPLRGVESGCDPAFWW